MPSTPHAWHGMLSVHRSFYKGALLKFVIQLPDEYPDAPPTVIFTLRHLENKFVRDDGSLRLGEEFDPWVRERLCAGGRLPLLALLRYLRDAFYRHDCIDEESIGRVREVAAKSRAQLREPDELFRGSRLRFEDEFDWAVHGPVLERMGCRSQIARRRIQQGLRLWIVARRQRRERDES
mmetsp:Transcript_25032/g.67157  ORF Transcript_25032/g.67157 Transcript_25032/m.67157 type:complete len:179 (-) Transcript_25032:142-678(-)